MVTLIFTYTIILCSINFKLSMETPEESSEDSLLMKQTEVDLQSDDVTETYLMIPLSLLITNKEESIHTNRGNKFLKINSSEILKKIKRQKAETKESLERKKNIMVNFYNITFGQNKDNYSTNDHKNTLSKVTSYTSKMVNSTTNKKKKLTTPTKPREFSTTEINPINILDEYANKMADFLLQYRLDNETQSQLRKNSQMRSNIEHSNKWKKNQLIEQLTNNRNANIRRFKFPEGNVTLQTNPRLVCKLVVKNQPQKKCVDFVKDLQRWVMQSRSAKK